MLRKHTNARPFRRKRRSLRTNNNLQRAHHCSTTRSLHSVYLNLHKKSYKFHIRKRTSITTKRHHITPITDYRKTIASINIKSSKNSMQHSIASYLSTSNPQNTSNTLWNSCQVKTKTINRLSPKLQYSNRESKRAEVRKHRNGRGKAK